MFYEPFTDDYVMEAYTNQLQDTSSHINNTLYAVTMEANLYLDILSDISLLEEATTAGIVKGATKSALSAKNMIGNVITFIKNIFARFKDFLQTAFQNNEKWLAERKKDFSSMNYTGINISMVPYWEGDGKGQFDRISSKIKAVDVKRTDRHKDITSKEQFNEKVLGDFMLDGDLATGIKNYYRVGRREGMDAKTIAEDQLKNLITGTMIPYVENHTKSIAETQKQINIVTNQLKIIEREFNNRGMVKESVLFGTFLESTDFATQGNFSILFENDQEEKNAPSSKDKKDKNHSSSGSTKVSMSNTGSPEETQTRQDVADGSGPQLQLMRNYTSAYQLSLAASLTVSQERYTAYLNAIRAVWKEANTRHGRKGNTKGKEENK